MESRTFEQLNSTLQIPHIPSRIVWCTLCLIVTLHMFPRSNISGSTFSTIDGFSSHIFRPSSAAIFGRIITNYGESYGNIWWSPANSFCKQQIMHTKVKQDSGRWGWGGKRCNLARNLAWLSWPMPSLCKERTPCWQNDRFPIIFRFVEGNKWYSI